MTLRLYTHPSCLAHDTGYNHVECPERVTAVIEALRAAFPHAEWSQAPAAPREALLRVHTPELVAQILDKPVDAIHWLDPDTALSPDTAMAASHAAGAVLAATDWALQGDHRRAFCAVRPPGHHAESGTPMGFCLFNNVAVGAAHALAASGIKRVAIADFDVHHGNGTEQIFLRDKRVLFASSQQIPLYPGTGGDDDDMGMGYAINAALPPLAPRAVFREVWRERLLPRIAAFKPELLFISAGFDAHRLDPLAQQLLEAEDYAWVTRELVAIANTHAQGRVVSTLEGGYDLDALRVSTVAHVGVLAEANYGAF